MRKCAQMSLRWRKGALRARTQSSFTAVLWRLQVYTECLHFFKNVDFSLARGGADFKIPRVFQTQSSAIWFQNLADKFTDFNSRPIN